MTSAMLVLSVVVLAISHLLSAFADQSTTDGLLWPVPKKSTFGKEVYLLQPESFQFLAIGAGADSDIVKDAFSRYSKILFTTPVPFVPTGATQASDGVLASLNVVVNSADETLGQDTDESCKILTEYISDAIGSFPTQIHSLWVEGQADLLLKLCMEC